MTLDDIAKLMRLMGEHRISRVTVGDVTLERTRFDAEPTITPMQRRPEDEDDDPDDGEFVSTAAPMLRGLMG